MLRRLLCSAAVCLMSGALAAAEPAPQLVKSGDHFALQVDGKPFFVLAGQIHNSDAWPQMLEHVWPALDALHANTLEAPVYWEQLEPKPGAFDYANVDALIEGARAHHQRLILLWFGSWKNGQMHYVPEWIKANPKQYPRTLDPSLEPTDVLSPHAPANVAADRAAFVALMTHLKAVDGERHTVIMVQVENEPGAIGSIRDFGPAAQAAFDGPVPASLTQALGKPSGNWRAAFGPDADEMFNAYATARYIETVAAAGKAAYPLPLYVNTWLRYKGKHIPGYDYPSGGATYNVLDLWKATAPSIDLIGTDLYSDDFNEYRKVVGQYHRTDNPTWISETGFEAGIAPYLFYVLGRGGIGFSVFGMDPAHPSPEHQAAVAAYAPGFALIDSINTLAAQAAFEGRLQTAVEDKGQPQQILTFGPWRITASFGAPGWGDAPPILRGSADTSGRALAIQLAPDTLLVSGIGARLEFDCAPQAGRHCQVLSVEEGRYDQGRWIPRRLWNGDETDYGLNFGAQPVLLKVKMGVY